ncbi:hypothetical protein F4820DRAFT_333933 [Hypoxylon rubiginosum]|uniref:Uncharacterized protein n=1 Tax=Hypoxylon rubiginosum TaxID=110542 RepID=A0ACB9YYD0_9PEZI|nr:hypothetical protein F4820DRAFT_333933 [Hypoxylon rubiginosum]
MILRPLILFIHNSHHLNTSMAMDLENYPSNSAPEHTGRLRQELRVLRHLLGLTKENPTQTNFGRSLGKSSLKDVLYIAVDIDGTQDFSCVHTGHYLLGISILDARDLHSYTNKPKAKYAQDVIRSYLVQAGHSDHLSYQSDRFLFGDTQQIQAQDVKAYLQKLIRHRQYVLVTYGGESTDCKFIQQLRLITRPLYHIDVLKVAQYPLQMHYRYSLAKLLDALNLPWMNLHVAGNDARFTLHAMLMLAVRDWNLRNETTPAPMVCETLSCLKGIAKAWRLPEQEQEPYQVSLAFLFEGPGDEGMLVKKKKDKWPKVRPEKTPEEKAVPKEQKKLSRERKQIKAARQPKWLFDLGDQMMAN